jgi:hypothetical protein
MKLIKRIGRCELPLRLAGQGRGGAALSDVESGRDKPGHGELCCTGPSPELPGSQIALASLGRKASGIALPDDEGVFQHIDPVGMGQREGDVLFA